MSFLGKLFVGFILVLIIVAFISLIPVIVSEYKQQKAYLEFCEERPAFCYCNAIECEFRTLRTEKYVNNSLISNEFSEDTKALCDLAKELNDKRTIYKVGCEL